MNAQAPVDLITGKQITTQKLIATLLRLNRIVMGRTVDNGIRHLLLLFFVVIFIF